MSVEVLLQRLEGVRPSGQGRWVAKCPAHPDKSPSLSVCDRDGIILLHCFALCETADVLAAVGLSFSDLYPKPVGKHYPPKRARMYRAEDLLRLIARESMIVAIHAEALSQTATQDIKKDLDAAVNRIVRALAHIDG